MQHQTRGFIQPIRLMALFGAIALAFAYSLAFCPQAHAVTAAEKQAEADEVFAQIDSLQTNLNKVMAEYDAAQKAYEEACASRDEAEAKIEAENKRIEQLQGGLSSFAVGMYKNGGAGTFLDVIMDATTFKDFVSSWDACNSIAAQGVDLLNETRDARAQLMEAQARYEAEGDRAESEMDAAAEAQREIEETQEALRVQAQQLSQEAAELQIQEELAAEAARQAEEARKRREAELAAAAEEAAKQAQAQAAAAAAGADGGGETQWQDVESGSSAGGSVIMGAGYFTHPCPTASYSSGFGYRTFDNSFHMGLDMAAPEGTPYYAADSGTVMYATNDGGYNGGAGNWIVIAHGSGIVTKYMHSSVTYVSPGDYVERGQNIGLVGNTGNSFGAHLHFQVEVNGVAVNPANYL